MSRTQYRRHYIMTTQHPPTLQHPLTAQHQTAQHPPTAEPQR